MSTPTHEDLQELLGVYAVDAIDSSERAAVESHLEGCPRCRAELDALREAAAALGHKVEEVPSGLWDRIATSLGSSDQPVLDPAPDIATAADIAIGSARVAPRRLSSRLAVVLAVAAVVAALVLGVLYQSATRQEGNLRSALAANAQVAAIDAAMATPGHRVVDLKGADGASVLKVVTLPSGRGYVTSSRLAPLPGDETYQLWGSIQNQAISLGLLGNDPRPGGFTVASGVPSTFMVTVEPAGGVVVPTSSPAASGTLPA